MAERLVRGDRVRRSIFKSDGRSVGTKRSRSLTRAELDFHVYRGNYISPGNYEYLLWTSRAKGSGIKDQRIIAFRPESDITIRVSAQVLDALGGPRPQRINIRPELAGERRAFRKNPRRGGKVDYRTEHA